MRRPRALAAFAAAALATTFIAAGATTSEAAKSTPEKPKRVVIVLFDQMLPQYADEFDMPNFRKVRKSGTNFKKAYLGYMASETVMAHNVITSGLEPRHMGWTDEAYRDHGNVFAKGADQMHITGDLSLSDFALIEKNNGVAYPKLADYLHTKFPGTKFITVGEKSYAVESATGATGDIAVRMSSRRSNVTADQPDGLPQPVDSRRPRKRAVALTRGQERAVVPEPGRPRRPDPLRPLLHQRRQGQPLRHEGRLPVLALPR